MLAFPRLSCWTRVLRADQIFSYALAKFGINITLALSSNPDMSLKTAGNSPGLKSVQSDPA